MDSIRPKYLRCFSESPDESVGAAGVKEGSGSLRAVLLRPPFVEGLAPP